MVIQWDLMVINGISCNILLWWGFEPRVLVKNVLYPIISSAFTIFLGDIGGSRYTKNQTRLVENLV